MGKKSPSLIFVSLVPGCVLAFGHTYGPIWTYMNPYIIIFVYVVSYALYVVYIFVYDFRLFIYVFFFDIC